MKHLKKINIGKFSIGQPAICDIVTKDNFVVLERGGVVNQNLLNALRKRDYPELYYNYESLGVNAVQMNVLESITNGSIENLNQSGVIRKIEQSSEDNNPLAENFKSPLSNTITQISVKERTPKYKNKILNFHDSIIEELESLYKGIVYKNWKPEAHFLAMIDRIMEIFVIDKNILLSLCALEYEADDYLYRHVVNVAILSMNIATAAGYDEEHVRNIGLGALLSDIGMAYVNEEIRFSNNKLNPDALYEIKKHPIISANFIDSMPRIPNVAGIIAYQVHEREDGTGYPRGKKGHGINNMSRIVAVADVYMALAGKRSYRPAFKPFTAMKEVIEMVKVGKLSTDAMRAFLKYVSIFPVGSLVKLNDNRIGRVIGSNENNVANPEISILTDENENVLSEDKIEQVDLAAANALRVTEPKDTGFIDLDKMQGF